MNPFRYRRPSLNTILGITKAKKEAEVTEAEKQQAKMTASQTANVFDMQEDK